MTTRGERARLIELAIIDTWLNLLERADKLSETGNEYHAEQARDVVKDSMRDMIRVLRKDA